MKSLKHIVAMCAAWTYDWAMQPKLVSMPNNQEMLKTVGPSGAVLMQASEVPQEAVQGMLAKINARILRRKVSAKNGDEHEETHAATGARRGSEVSVPIRR